MAVWIRSSKAMFLVRDGQACKLKGNWRRMHIKSMRDDNIQLGHCIEHSGVQKTFIEAFRQPLDEIVDQALGEGHRSLDDMNHIPLF